MRNQTHIDAWCANLKACLQQMPSNVELLVREGGGFDVFRLGDMKKASENDDPEFSSIEAVGSAYPGAKVGNRISGRDNHF
ncbi:hypothetical protein [Aestuariispira insulae]|uniref:Uncharacterized protein n=1 Tax=Aestuariispira insulae TaxID=1461337 RepID=A0A3D9H5C1_9PROT|nr:hypothetical protein [Aestuariispira insulae]RED44146.1 hypothetical protein DFP90_11750 [Aestuariispira insulae]